MENERVGSPAVCCGCGGERTKRLRHAAGGGAGGEAAGLEHDDLLPICAIVARGQQADAMRGEASAGAAGCQSEH